MPVGSALRTIVPNSENLGPRCGSYDPPQSRVIPACCFQIVRKHGAPFGKSLYLATMSVSSGRISDPALLPIADKLAAGEPLSYDDGVALYASRDVHGIGRLADG